MFSRFQCRLIHSTCTLTSTRMRLVLKCFDRCRTRPHRLLSQCQAKLGCDLECFSHPSKALFQGHRCFTSCVAESDRETFIVRSSSDLEALSRLCNEEVVVAVDTEFTSFPMYKPNVEVIQVATRNFVGAVDCAVLREEYISDFVATLNGKELIMHDARMDLQILWELGLQDVQVFDTQIAHMMVNCGPRIGLGDLLKELLDVEIDKSQQTSDWRIRPLSDSQIRYALGDVLHMHNLRDKLKATIVERHRDTWFADEMQKIAHTRASTDDADLWRQVRGSRKLKDDVLGLKVLQAVAVWREATARSACLAPNLVARDDVLVQMAVQRPTTEAELHTLRGLKPGMLRYHARTLLKCIHTAVHGDDPTPPAPTLAAHEDEQTVPREAGSEMPSLDAAGIGALPREWFFNRVQDAQLHAVHSLLMAQAHAASLQMGMSVDVLAPQEAVRDIACSIPGEECAENVILACPWRRHAVGNDLLRLRNAVIAAEQVHGAGILPPLAEALK
eukprot:m.280876 g.280876  ORF g.280876 m.280876 type:complete len:503 (+) comp19830_c0_seq4:222-1730(+)